MTGFQFKTTPFPHQLDIFNTRRDFEGDAIFAEQGTGKTKIVLDNVADLYLRGKVNGLLVLAPRGVAENWVTDEIPVHLCDAVAKETRSYCWKSPRSSTKRQQAEEKALLEHRGLSVVALGYEAFVTKAGKEFAKKFLLSRKTFYALDEATRIKTPGAKRTKTVIASAKYAPYRRILTGTPVTNGPFDIYSPVRFTHPTFWKEHGLGDYYAFKTQFGVFEKGWNGQTGREFDALVGFQNLDLLSRLLAKISVRVSKDVLNLPPKLYARRYYDPSPEQKRMYNQLLAEFMTFLGDGREVNAPLAIVRLLRLQQVLCGYVPVQNLTEDADGYLHIDNELILLEDNPRLDELMEVVEDTFAKTIIWARFTQDIDLICARLAAAGASFVRYDGKVSDKDRLANKQAFQDGDAQFFVANPAAAGEGLTLHAAETVIYYNNTFKLSERLQSEDRAHRAGLTHSVNYIDLVAKDTMDIDVLEALRDKIRVASIITRDRIREWVL